jgi:hypothetical protein
VTARHLRRSVLVAAALWLVAPAAAYGHTGGRISTDYEARIVGLTPARPGVSARVLEGDQKLELSVSPSHVVVVLGILGEPFLRFSAAGVEANAGSPTAWNSGIVRPADAKPRARAPAWHRITGGHVFAWHENRLRPRTITAAGGPGPRRIAGWSIPMLVDGRRAALVGSEWYAPAPATGVWIALGVALVAGGAAGARLGGRGMQRVLAAAILPVVVAAWLAGWLGILLFDHPSWVVVVLAGGYAAATVIVVGAAVTATSGNARFVAAGLIGALAAAFTMPEVEAFTSGFVLSALPATIARAAAVVSFAGGIALAAVCIPAMAEILSDDPLRRQLLAPVSRDG